MRILFVSEYFPPFTPGGAEWSTLHWAQLLADKGHQVQVATLNFGAPSQEWMGKVEVIRAPFPFKLPPGQRSVPWYSTRNPLFYIYFGLFVYRLAYRADIIHAQSENILVPAWFGAYLACKPIFFTIRDTGLLCPLGGICLITNRMVPSDCGWRRLVTTDARFFQRNYLHYQHWLSRMKLVFNLSVQWPDMLLKQFCLNKLTAIIAVSKGIADAYPHRVLQIRDRIHVIHNPAPASSQPLTSPEIIKAKWGLDGHFVALTVGKLSLGKGTYILLQAARILEEAGSDVLFVLAGKGSLRAELPSNVRLLGSLPHEQVLELYHVADVVVVPSIWPEPFSRTILEAMAAGKPVIGTDVGGTPEIIEHEVSGLIIQRGDAVALADAIVRLKGDDTLRTRLGKSAELRSKHVFGESVLLSQLEKVYRTPIP